MPFDYIEDWADLNGTWGRRPRCGRRVWTESACGFECDGCGYTGKDEEEEE